MFVDNRKEHGFLVNSDRFENILNDNINLELYDYPNNYEVNFINFILYFLSCGLNDIYINNILK